MPADNGLETRVAQLEQEVAELRAQLHAALALRANP